MLDLAEEIIIPAFLQQEDNKRHFGKTEFFFTNVSIKALDESNKEKPVVAIIGRFIKDTILERTQVFEEGKGLIESHDEMRSSPSAIFALILNHHRLLYLKETKYAPAMGEFKGTLLHYIRAAHKQFIHEKLKQNEKAVELGSEEKISKGELLEEYPNPRIELIPISGEDTLENFLKQFSILKSIEIALVDKNDEADNDDFFELLAKKRVLVGSDKTTVKHTNNEGLDIDKSVKYLAEAAAQGNQKIILSGNDAQGAIIRGNNEDFQIRKDMGDVSRKPEEATATMYETFMELVENKVLKLPAVARVTDKITAIYRRYKK